MYYAATFALFIIDIHREKPMTKFVPKYSLRCEKPMKCEVHGGYTKWSSRLIILPNNIVIG